MAGMVSGLVIQIRAMEIGRLARSSRARARATKVWPGMGRNAQNSPTNMATDTEWRLRWSRFGSLISGRIKFKDLMSRCFLWAGIQRRRSFLGMGVGATAVALLCPFCPTATSGLGSGTGILPAGRGGGAGLSLVVEEAQHLGLLLEGIPIAQMNQVAAKAGFEEQVTGGTGTAAPGGGAG